MHVIASAIISTCGSLLVPADGFTKGRQVMGSARASETTQRARNNPWKNKDLLTNTPCSLQGHWQCFTVAVCCGGSVLWWHCDRPSSTGEQHTASLSP